MTPEERAFVDSMGLVFDELGAPRMMGRIVGWMLICEPMQQSEPQLCAALGASKGAVNTLTRQLVQSGLLERVVVSGERAAFLQVRSGAWSDLLRLAIRKFHNLREVSAEGLSLLADAPPERRERLQRFHDFYAYIEREFEPLIDRFEEEER